MQSRLHVLVVLTVAVFLTSSLVMAQTPASGSVTIQGWDQGPVYPCGNSSCPIYDSGAVQITVNGFTATTTYSHTIGQSTAEALAIKLASQLNVANSPVIATRSNTKILLTSKITGTASNYPLSTSVTRSTLFPNGSFAAVASASALSNGTGAPGGSGGSGGSGGTGGTASTPVGNLLKQTSNNTSLCSSSNDPGGNLPYCTAFFNGFGTRATNASAQTPIPDSAAGHVSNLSLRQLMYPHWNGRMICEYQPWFGLKSHKSVGYNQNSPATIAAQDSFMITEGCDINLIDFYGSLDPNQRFNLTTTNTIFADLSTRSGYPLRFGIMEDKGALKSSCPTSGLTASATVTCLQNALRTDMDYINAHYAQGGAYWTDAGWPVIAYFGGKSDWPVLSTADWNAVWTAVKTHTDRYPVPFKFVFQYGSFTSAPYDNGRYAWVQPAAFGSPQQMWWGSHTNPAPIYLDSFYTAALSSPNQLAIGALYKGFDDNNASWSGNRVVAQQCGQVWMKTASEMSKFYGGSKPQIPYVQVMTWNDYEEGTAVESGIDNCYAVNASLAGNLLSWSLQSSDPTYASLSTIHHFTVYYADTNGNLYHAAASVPVSTTSLDLSTIVPPGTWSVYVEMVGQPLIINRMSNAVTLIH